jgi:transaldolase
VTKLHDLFDDEGQSPWLDNIRRGWLTDGEMQTWIEQGIRGLTSNPSIFQKAIADSDDYDEQFGDLVRDDVGVTAAYWDLVTTDIEAALALLRPVHEAGNGLDGYVSVEVDPGLARDTDGTIAAARELHTRIDEPNLYVKIPATAEGVPAIRQMIAEKRSINVTLIFSLDRYADVMEAYLSGLEATEGDLSAVSSVASFFVSRVDTEVDRRLDEIGSPDALALRGKAAVANARAAYVLFGTTFSGPRWEALAARGARPQRPLWASTSTKNDAYPDTLYVDELIGPDTVNTVPDATLDSFVDHGTVRRTIDTGEEPGEVLAAVREAGVDLDEVARLLEEQGVAAFEKSFDELLETLGAKADDLRSA